MTDTFICSHCKQSKPVTEFYTDTSHSIGHDYYCKPCRNARRKQLRHSDKQATRRKHQQRYAEHLHARWQELKASKS